METLFLNYMNSVHLSKWHYLLIFYIYLIVYVSFYFCKLPILGHPFLDGRQQAPV